MAAATAPSCTTRTSCGWPKPRRGRAAGGGPSRGWQPADTALELDRPVLLEVPVPRMPRPIFMNSKKPHPQVCLVSSVVDALSNRPETADAIKQRFG